MNIVTAEALALQLNLGKTSAIFADVQKRMDNTKGFNDFAKHILTLNDSLQPIQAYVGLSNNSNYFKIKCIHSSETIQKTFQKIVYDFGEKYKINFEKIPEKNVYYMIGKDKDAA